jgi:KaiC/GvpD/RAD55 family RecA-like ATPase
MAEEKQYPQLPGQIPEFLRNDGWYEVDVSDYVLDFTEQYKPPRYTLSWNGIKFAPLGGIHNITGQAGNGKTMTIAQFMATFLKGQIGGLKYELSESIPHPRVLYIDTEMEKDNTIAVKNRVLSMAGRDTNQEYDDFMVLMLREVPDGKQASKDRQGNVVDHVVPASVMRWRMTLKAIWQYKPNVVFIDGLMDVIADFNDNVMCQELIYKCMQVASHYDISLWCLLHQNPGSEKLVGHLGSFVERKVTDIFRTKKTKDVTTGDVSFTVSQIKARGRDVPDWQFRVNPVNSWGMPEQLGFEDATTNNEHELQNLDNLFKGFNWKSEGVTWTAIDKYLYSKGITSHTKRQNMIDTACMSRIIYRNDKKKWFYNGLDKSLQNDSPEQLPFARSQEDNPAF